mmetsp:Transcript_1783/g.3069  ORF Transcript_1783/g.3069 Transcript_1783/m.3069 type:complete len:865 (+) Transcript_1783:117-2711(+)
MSQKNASIRASLFSGATFTGVRRKDDKRIFNFARQRWLRRVFADNLPFRWLRRMKGTTLVALGAFCYSLMVFLFVFFFLEGYNQSRYKYYVSLSRSNAVCTEVKRQIVGQFYATAEGLWEGSPNYHLADVLYRYDFNTLEASPEEFFRLFDESFNVQPIMDLQAERSLPWNLLLWLALGRLHAFGGPGGPVQVMVSTVTPAAVFRGDAFTGIVYSREFRDNSSCQPRDVLLADPTTSTVFFSPADSVACRTLLEPYVQSFSYFQLEVDMRSFIFAAAFNNGVYDLLYYPTVRADFLAPGYVIDTFNFDGYLLKASYYYPPLFEGVDHIVCVESVDPAVIWLRHCFVSIKGFIAEPHMYHRIHECNECTEASRRNPDCNRFSIDAAFLFPSRASSLSTANDDPPSENKEQIVADIIQLLNLTRASTSTLTAQQLTMAVHASSYNSSIDRNLLFQACPGCIVARLSLFKSSKTFTNYGNRLHKGHCRASINQTAISELGKNPPVALTENYYECHNNLETAILDGVSLSFGNASFWGPIVLISSLPLLFLILYICGARNALEKHSEGDCEDAAEELMELLLEVHEGDRSRVRPGGLVEQLVEELTIAYQLQQLNNGEMDGGDVEEKEEEGGGEGLGAKPVTLGTGSSKGSGSDDSFEDISDHMENDNIGGDANCTTAITIDLPAEALATAAVAVEHSGDVMNSGARGSSPTPPAPLVSQTVVSPGKYPTKRSSSNSGGSGIELSRDSPRRLKLQPNFEAMHRNETILYENSNQEKIMYIEDNQQEPQIRVQQQQQQAWERLGGTADSSSDFPSHVPAAASSSLKDFPPDEEAREAPCISLVHEGDDDDDLHEHEEEYPLNNYSGDAR